MRKPLMGIAVMLAAACVVGAQEGTEGAGKDTGNVAVAFRETSAAQVNLLAPADNGSESRSVALARPASPAAESGANAFPAEPAAAPSPKFVIGARDDYRWQLGVGVEFFRFRSSILNASMVGLNTTVTYFTNDWFAFEGNLVTGFAPEIYDREHVKYFGGGGGIRVGSRRAKWEPWGHALFGGGHLQPQTAGNSKNALMIQAGIGVDYRVNARLSLRGEGDWVYTTFFNQTQNNFQAFAGIVFHF
jgi:hypothetical protein